MFYFSIIIHVKSFELTLNFNSLHLYRQTSGGGNGSQVQQAAVIIMF